MIEPILETEKKNVGFAIHIVEFLDGNYSEPKIISKFHLIPDQKCIIQLTRTPENGFRIAMNYEPLNKKKVHRE